MIYICKVCEKVLESANEITLCTECQKEQGYNIIKQVEYNIIDECEE